MVKTRRTAEQIAAEQARENEEQARRVLEAGEGEGSFVTEPEPLTPAEIAEEEEQVKFDSELNRLMAAMRSVSSDPETDIEYWLYRADEKNRSFQGDYLHRYPKDTDVSQIVDDAQTVYGGGKFVVLFRVKGQFKHRYRLGVEKREKTVIAEPDVFDKLALDVRKAMVLDQSRKTLSAAVPQAPAAPATDPVANIMLTMLTNMQKQNTDLTLALINFAKAPREATPKATGDLAGLIEAVKLGSSLAGGKLPGAEDEEGSLLALLKPYAPKIIEILSAALSPKPAVPVAPSTRPALPGRPPVPAPPPAASMEPAAPVDAAMQRRYALLLEEIRDTITQPPVPEVFDGLADYLDRKFPGSTKDLAKMNDEQLKNHLTLMDPAFVDRIGFFIAFRDYLKNENLEELNETDLVSS